MKATTSDWFSTLTLRSMKDLACLLFSLTGLVRDKYPQHYDLFIELRNRLDDEYHGHKHPPRGIGGTFWERLGS